MKKLRIFISYSREDDEWKDRLLQHLGALLHRPDVEIWHDRIIATGDYWHELITEALEQSAAAVLLISPHFLSSSYIRDSEIPLLLRASQERGLRIFPVLVRRCAWEHLEWLKRLQVCSGEGAPLSECGAAIIDAAFTELTKELIAFLTHRVQFISDRPQGVRTNLSLSTTSFVGRSQELADVGSLLVQEAVRLVSITGPPGIGKTRLSRQLGRELIDQFPGGCWFANLIDAVSVAGIAHAVAQSLELTLASGQMTPQEAIVELIRSRDPLLLILDNFEQVVDLAGVTVGYWLDHLSNVKFLATSREILNLSEEFEYHLGPLPVPLADHGDVRLEGLSSCASVTLFVDRARQAWPQFELIQSNQSDVARICTELQGIPLAIELAAARVRVFSPEQIAEKLGKKLQFLRTSQRDRPTRQQTLYNSIDWSFRLLKDYEQSAFLQICIFRGDFFLEAAEHVVDLSRFQGAPPVCDVVQSLCEKNLLNVHQTRYGFRFDMYVAIQDYGQTVWQTIASLGDREALARRWAGFYIPYALEWNAKVHSSEGVLALDLLSLELENLFGIQDWFLDHGDAEVAAHAILAFAETMGVRGPAHLRVPRLMKSLEKGGGGSWETRVRLMTNLSAAHWSLGQWNEATELADGAVNLLPDADCSGYAAAALRQQGRIRTDRGYLRRALISLGRAKDIYQTIGDYSGISIIDGDMAGVFDRLGDLPTALSLLVEAEVMVGHVGDDAQRALVLNRRGLVLWHHGRADAALACFEEAEVINRGIGAIGWLGGHITNQGLALTDLDEFGRAFERFREAERIHRESGNQAWAAVNYGGWGRALLMRGNSGDLERGLEFVIRAEKLSRRVYYPENISLHAGDRGRGLFLLGRTTEARRAVREAVAIERTIGASKDIRHFCNLVLLARIERMLEHREECREASLRARDLAERLDIRKDHRIRRVREAIALLEEIEDLLVDRGVPEKRVSTLLAKYHGAPLGVDELSRIEEDMLKAFDQLNYEYPWVDLERDLREQGVTSLRIFGYGSLVNKESALRTLKSPADGRFMPAIAFGVIRLFNFEMPEVVRLRYRVLDDPAERGLLNAQVTGFMSDLANGVLVDVDVEEIEALRSREVGYDLQPVVCIPWEKGVRGAPVQAYILSCPNRLWKGRPLTDATLKPHREYLAQCCEGAASFSEAFLGFWLETTYLGDGETVVTPPLAQRSGGVVATDG